MFQVKAQEEPNGTSQSRLLILLPSNNRTSDTKFKPCVFNNGNVYTGRELERPKKTVCSLAAH